MNDCSLCIVNNIPSPYRRALFDEIARQAEDLGIEFTVLYLSDREAVRDWDVKLRSYETVLPVLMQKRNPRTPTSDFIINIGFSGRVLRATHVILFGYNYPTYIVIVLLRTLLCRPTYLFCETTLSDTSTAALKKIFKTNFFRFAFNAFIVPGKRSEKYLVSHGVSRDKIFVARNASPMRRKTLNKLLVKESLRVLYVGRLSPEKRILEFTQAFADIGIGYHLTIVGDGPEAIDISEVAKNNPCIDVVGSKGAEELSAIYENHDVLVLISESEPWGLVVNEAINHGLALVLSKQVGSAPELMDGNGVYLSEISPKMILSALKKVKRNILAYRDRSLEIAKESTVDRQAADFLTIVTKRV